MFLNNNFGLAQFQRNPCNPSPCGPNSQCREINGQGVCSCVQGYIGSPPTCRPECINSLECPLNEACSNQKCNNPCIGVCGHGAKCTVVNHSPICSCPSKYEGDPFRMCQLIGMTYKSSTNWNLHNLNLYFEIILVERPIQSDPIDPCRPSPCGPNSECRRVGESPSCSCLRGFIGSPPTCRPECVSNNECVNNLACIRQKCSNPCSGLCGPNAECRVVSHTPMCVCLPGYVGDPFSQCSVQQDQHFDIVQPCTPNPCGSNSVCRQQNNAGACECLPNYVGNPYEGCRPECTLNSDCLSNQVCTQNKCIEPCRGLCGSNADCHVSQHLPECTCIRGYIGDPYKFCEMKPLQCKHYIWYRWTSLF